MNLSQDYWSINKENVDPINEDVSVLDLFSGAGFASAGLKKMFNVSLALDSNIDCCKSYKENHSQTTVVNRKVEDFNVVKKDADLLFYHPTFKYSSAAKHHLLFGSPPCKEFSRQNKKRDLAAGKLLFSEFLRICKEMQPDFVVMENVVAVPRDIKQWVVKELEKLSFKVTSQIIDAAEFGSIQARRRWLTIGSKHKHIALEKVTTLKSSREVLTNQPSKMSISKEILDLVKDIKVIGKWTNLPGRIRDNYYIVDPSRAFPTIVHPLKSRYFKILIRKDDQLIPLQSLDQLKKLDFPLKQENVEVSLLTMQELLAAFDVENYRLHGTLSSQAQQIANAFPAAMAYSISKSIHNSIQDTVA